MSIEHIDRDGPPAGATRIMVIPPGGEWIIGPLEIGDALAAIDRVLPGRYRVTVLTDRLSALTVDPSDGDYGEAEVNPYLPEIGALYGVSLAGRGPAVLTGGLVRVGTSTRVMPLPGAQAKRVGELIEHLKSRMLPIRPQPGA